MKHSGSVFPYSAERERELMRAYRIVMARTRHINMRKVFAEVVAMPCARFWVTEERALAVVRTMMAGRLICPSSEKRAMYEELYSRVEALRASHRDAPLGMLVSIAVNSPAPRFFLSPSQAKHIINRMRKGKPVT